MTFSGASRSCIGYKFAIYEMKALLLYLVKAFYFELAVDPNDVIRNELYVPYFLFLGGLLDTLSDRYLRIVTRPLLRSEKEEGAQLPMIIRPATLA